MDPVRLSEFVARVALVASLVSVTVASACTGSPAPHRPGRPGQRVGSTQQSGTASHAVGGVAAAAAVPRFAHIVVVVEENRAYSDVIGSGQAPYINALARSGTLLTRSYGVRHPSEPNYLALFSGSTHGLTDDSCPHTYQGRNLGSQLRSHGLAFAGYSESLPSVGYLGCSAGPYARKHAPWTDFANLPGSVGRPLSRFPADYRRLPRVSFVVPNVNNDMHDGSVAQGDRWLRRHLGGYVTWAHRHNSLLVVTWDEDDMSAGNHIPGLLVGAHVRHVRYRGRVDHYTMLRTIEAACRLPALGRAARRSPITGIWMP
jgi:acid phosphatase